MQISGKMAAMVLEKQGQPLRTQQIPILQSGEEQALIVYKDGIFDIIAKEG